jgi:hypothetical protein
MKDLSDIRKAYNQNHGLFLSSDEDIRKEETPSRPRKRGVSFQEKCSDLSKYIDSFTVPDFIRYFEVKAGDAGIKYVTTNKARDGAVFKKLLSTYAPIEICLMIEFLFLSSQTYLDKEITKPTVLISGWLPRIYKDSKSWADGKFSNSTNKKSSREWTGGTEDKVTIGEWE